MDWDKLAAVDVLQLERSEALLDSVYTFLEENELGSAEVARAEPGQLAKMLSVIQSVLKVKKVTAFIYLFKYCLFFIM